MSKKQLINHNTEANNVDKVLSNHMGKIGLTPDQYDMNFTIFNELTNSNVRPDCCVKIGTKYGIVFENKVDYKNLQGAKIQGLKYLELLKKNNALCDRSVLIVTDGLSFDVGQYEIQDDAIVFVKSLQIDTFDQITMEWMTQYAGTIVREEKKAITSGDKAELKKTFDKINNYLRDKGLGKDSRLHITSAMLFLKLIKENDDLFQIMDKIRVNKIEQSLDVLRAVANESSILTCFEKLAEAYEGDFNFNLADYKDKNIIEGLFAIVDELHLANYDLDIKGEAFEYFINYGNTSSDMGEYFTPRHIVNFMIKLLDNAFFQRSEKRFGKTYLDPTCGTGGFLIKIFQRIQKELKDNKTDTPINIQKLKAETVFGNELNLRSSEIAKMNMILTGDGHSNISQGDFLEEKKKRAGKYDVTIGNPPFGGKKEKSEVHFVDGFLDDVKEGGYSLIVIPEGILFNSSNEFVKLRKRLLMQGRILSIISLPKGVFLPYAGVKTDIIFWKKEQGISDYDIEMVDIRNDGFSLDSHRRPLSTSDLDLYFSDKQSLIDNGQIYMVNTNTIYDVHELARLESEQVALAGQIASDTTLIKTIKKQLIQITDPSAKDVKLSRINQLTTDLKTNETKLKKIKDKVKGFDVNLVVSRYRPRKYNNTEKTILIQLDEVCEFVSGYSFSAKQFNSERRGLPLIRIGDFEDGVRDQTVYRDHEYDDSMLVNPGDLLLSLSGSFKVGVWTDGIGLLNQRIAKLLPSQKINKKFLLYIMESLLEEIKNKSTSMSVANISINEIKKLQIPLPSLEEQQRIVDEIEKAKSIQDIGRKMLNEYEPSLGYDKEWQEVSLVDSELFSIESGGTPSSEKSEYRNGNIKRISLIDLPDTDYITEIENTKRTITEEGLKNSSAKLLPPNTIFVSSRATIGRVALSKEYIATNQGFKNILIKNFERVDPMYLAYVMKSKKKELEDLSSVGTFAEVSKSKFEQISFLLPPLEIQQQIVAQLDEEQRIINENRKLITMLDDKIQQIVNRAWGE